MTLKKSDFNKLAREFWEEKIRIWPEQHSKKTDALHVLIRAFFFMVILGKSKPDEISIRPGSWFPAPTKSEKLQMPGIKKDVLGWTAGPRQNDKNYYWCWGACNYEAPPDA